MQLLKLLCRGGLVELTEPPHLDSLSFQTRNTVVTGSWTAVHGAAALGTACPRPPPVLCRAIGCGPTATGATFWV